MVNRRYLTFACLHVQPCKQGGLGCWATLVSACTIHRCIHRTCMLWRHAYTGWNVIANKISLYFQDTVNYHCPLPTETSSCCICQLCPITNDQFHQLQHQNIPLHQQQHSPCSHPLTGVRIIIAMFANLFCILEFPR